MKKIKYQDIVNLNKEATRKARLLGEDHGGGEKWYADDIQKIVDAIHYGANYQEPPERICAKCIKIFVTRPQPFNDCNHRTMTLLTHRILDSFYPNIEPNVEKWKGVREKIGGWSERETEWWIYQAIIEKASIHASLRSNLRPASSHNRLNSSSVIEGKYAPPPIKDLWQLHAEGITMEHYKSIANEFYQKGWWSEARPSKRYSGRFDLYIKRR